MTDRITEDFELEVVVGSEHDLRRAYAPRSMAVVGASGREGTLSWWPLHHIVTRGYRGEVYPVNPRYDTLEGIPCHPTIDDLPEGIDLAVVALNAEAAMDSARRCADRGFGTVLLPAQGIGESGPQGRLHEEELVGYLRKRGTRLAGPNSDGLGNLANGALASIQPLFDQGVESGRLAVVTQSGATAGSLLNRLRMEGIGCRLYASTGNEADLGVEDHLSYMLQHPGVEMVLSFVESIRRPADFVAVTELASRLGKPVGLIKVGRSEQGARRAAAHTGALAGDDAVYDAVFEASGVVRVGELAELVALAKVYLAAGVPRSSGVGVMSVSGGQAGAVADAIASSGLSVPAIDPTTKAELDEILTFGEGFNPCDLTGEVARDPTLAARVYRAFGDQDDIGVVVYARKLLTGTASIDAAARVAAEVVPGRAALIAYAMDGEVPSAERAHYDGAGIPVFESLHDLTAALRGLDRHRRRRRLEPPERPDDLPPSRIGPLAGGLVDEREAKRLLAAYGLPAPADELVTGEDAAVAAAKRLGFPVVAKVVAAGLAHKTEIGGVMTGLDDETAVRAAYRRITEGVAQAAPEVVVDGVSIQVQAPPGVEMIAGATVDPSFGPFVLVGLGGVAAEILGDAVLRPAPVAVDDVRTMISELRGRALLEGFRGSPPADVDAFADAVVRLSWFAHDHADTIDEVDLNPVVVWEHGAGVCVLDALIVVKGM